jgi:hypothetical protein
MSPGTIASTTHASPRSISEGAAPSNSQSHKMLLTTFLHDRATGRDTLWQCVSASERAPAEDLMVEANPLANVAAALPEPS